MSPKACAALFLFSLFLPACYSIVKRDAGLDYHQAPPQANHLLFLLEQKNNAARSFKGIGKISVWDSGMLRTSRAAWAGAADGRLRIEFLGLPGQPVAKFVFDGSRYSFFSHMDQQSYEETSSDPNLKPVTGVSIKASEVIAYLAGGIPVYAHDSIELEQGGAGDAWVLVFRKFWLGVVEKVFFNGSVIEKVEIFRWGKKVYQVRFKDLRIINDHPVPFNLVIENEDKQGFSFAVDRYWSDIYVQPSMFEINPAN